jgi:hypothetical protein
MNNATALREAIKQGKLKTPVQRGFSMASWDASLREIGFPTSDDKRLYDCARFLLDN